jgi:sigma-B regulation protein RsbU (phosphoserine phosphatase)
VIRFVTLRAKILFLIFIAILLPAIFMILLGKEIVETSLDRLEQNASFETLHIVMLDIGNQYRNLRVHTDSIMELRREKMKDMAGIVVSLIDGDYESYRKGLVPEEEAKALALEEIKRFRYGNNDYFFVYDQNFVAIAHPDPTFMGKMLKDYRDANGKLIIQELMKTSLQPGGGFTNYWWKRLNDPKPVRKLGYSIFYPKWEWMIGTGLYLDDIDQEYEKRLAAIIQNIAGTFSKLRTDKSREYFLFTGHKEILIPSQFPSDENVKLSDFMAAANSSGKSFRYRSADGVWRLSHVTHFEPLDWYVVYTINEDVLKEPGKMLVRRTLIFAVPFLLIGLLIASYLASRISRPVTALTVYARNMVSQEFQPQPLIEELSRRGDETGKLASAFSFMQKKLQDYIRDLKETTAAKERTDSELRIAREIQMSMLPKNLDITTHRRNFSIYGHLEPARDVGGDFYDYFYVDETHLCLVIGDVCDKGVPASLFMAVSKTLIHSTVTIIRNYVVEGVPANEILKRANTELQRENEKCMFATVFLVLVNLENGEMQYSNAGHNFPFLVQETEIRRLDDLRASPLGIRANQEYPCNTISLRDNNTLFLYTDGIPEAVNAEGKQFTLDRFKKILLAHQAESVEKLADHVLRDLNEFKGNNPQSDDIALLVFRYYVR